MRAGEILFKPQDIAHLGPAPAVDRLVIIAHAADIPVPLRQQPQPQVLGDVGILILVHQNISEPALILLQQVGVTLENLNAIEKQITKIHGVQSSKPLLIVCVYLDDVTLTSFVGVVFRRTRIRGEPYLYVLRSRNCVGPPRSIFVAIYVVQEPTLGPTLPINLL